MNSSITGKALLSSAVLFSTLLATSAAHACSVVPQNASFSLDDFTSKVTNTIELEDTLSLRINGDCAGSINISFKPREVITMEEEPTIFISSKGNPLFNSIVGGINSASIKLPAGESFVSIPLRLVADVSLANHHSDIARSIGMSIETVDEAGIQISKSHESIALLEGTNPTHFPSTAPQSLTRLNISESNAEGVITRSVSPTI